MKQVVVIIVALLLPSAAAAQSDQTIGGSITGNGQSVCLTFAGAGSGAVQVAGTFVATLAFTKTVNDADLVTLTAVNGTGSEVTGTDGSGLGIFHFGAAGLRKVCVTSTAYTSGTATVTIRVSQGTGIVQAVGGGGGGLTDAQLRASPVPVSAASLPLPAGAATAADQPTVITLGDPLGVQTGTIAAGYVPPSPPSYLLDSLHPLTLDENGNLVIQGAVTVTSGDVNANQGFPNGMMNAWPIKIGDGDVGSPVAITATTPTGSEVGLVVRNIPSGTQAISGTVTANLAAGTNNIGDVDVLTLPAITGTVTANAGTNLNTSALALDATLTNRTQKTQLTDGTRDGTIKAASTAAGAADTSLVVGLSPNSSLPAGTNGIGKLTANTGVTIGAVEIAAAQTLATVSTVTNVATIGTSVTPGTAAANLGKAEDATAASGDTGVAMLLQRKDTNSTLTSADGDYVVPAADNYGAAFMRRDHPNRFRCTVTVSTATTIQALGGSCATPGAGLSLYITDIEFMASASGIAADAFPTLKYGTGGTCGTGTTVFWGSLTAAAVRAEKSYATPIKIPANSEICWITTTAGSKFIVVTGYIAP